MYTACNIPVPLHTTSSLYYQSICIVYIPACWWVGVGGGRTHGRSLCAVPYHRFCHYNDCATPHMVARAALARCLSCVSAIAAACLPTTAPSLPSFRLGRDTAICPASSAYYLEVVEEEEEGLGGRMCLFNAHIFSLYMSPKGRKIFLACLPTSQWWLSQ